MDRREQAFEDTSVFESGDPQAAQDYYLGFQYRRVPARTRSSSADWGLKLQLERPAQRGAARARAAAGA